MREWRDLSGQFPRLRALGGGHEARRASVLTPRERRRLLAVRRRHALDYLRRRRGRALRQRWVVMARPRPDTRVQRPGLWPTAGLLWRWIAGILLHAAGLWLLVMVPVCAIIVLHGQIGGAR